MTVSSRYILVNFIKGDKGMKMFRVSYLNKKTNELLHKGNFDSDTEAYEWIKAFKDEIVPLRLLIWSDYLKCYRVIEKL